MGNLKNHGLSPSIKRIFAAISVAQKNLKFIFRIEKPETHTFIHCQNCHYREQFA